MLAEEFLKKINIFFLKSEILIFPKIQVLVFGNEVTIIG